MYQRIILQPESKDVPIFGNPGMYSGSDVMKSARRTVRMIRKQLPHGIHKVKYERIDQPLHGTKAYWGYDEPDSWQLPHMRVTVSIIIDITSEDVSYLAVKWVDLNKMTAEQRGLLEGAQCR